VLWIRSLSRDAKPAALVFGASDMAADLGAETAWEPLPLGESRIVQVAASPGISGPWTPPFRKSQALPSFVSCEKRAVVSDFKWRVQGRDPADGGHPTCVTSPKAEAPASPPQVAAIFRIPNTRRPPRLGRPPATILSEKGAPPPLGAFRSARELAPSYLPPTGFHQFKTDFGCRIFAEQNRDQPTPASACRSSSPNLVLEN